MNIDVHQHLWFYIGTLDMCVCVPPKNAGTSFYRTVFNLQAVEPQHVRSAAVNVALLKGWGPYTPAQVTQYYPDKHKVLAFRHPLDRFISLWRDKCRDGDDNMAFMRGWSPLTLLDYIRTNPLGNAHWVPQYLYRVWNCQIVQHNQLMKTLGLPDHYTDNKTEWRSDDPPMPIDAVRDLYSQDHQLWTSLFETPVLNGSSPSLTQPENEDTTLGL